MIIKTIQKILNAINFILPMELIAITKTGRIKWMNKKIHAVPKNISYIGEMIKIDSFRLNREFFEKNKEVICSQKELTTHLNEKEKDFTIIRIPYSEKGFRGLLILIIDITSINNNNILIDTSIINS